jgi:hypothetical protein
LSLVLRRFFLFAPAVAIGFVAVLGCEERFSANPPPIAPESLGPASSSTSVDALFATTTLDAGAVARDTSHALTVTLCSVSSPPCPASEADASYRVVFGSGRGAIRSRGQAMADLYKELRDRTASGERLDAEPRAAGDGGTPIAMGGGSSPKASATNDDPIAQCAFQLLDLVDGVGEVSLDVVHASGAHGCRVSLGRAADGGISRCLVQDPERPRRPGR